MNLPPDNIRPLRVAIIEEHRYVRQALVERLQASPIIELVAGLAYLPSEPDDLCRQGLHAVLIGLPQRSVTNPRVLEEFIEHWTACGIQVLVLTSFVDASERDSLLSAGASQILLKQINTPELIDRIAETVQQKNNWSSE